MSNHSHDQLIFKNLNWLSGSFEKSIQRIFSHLNPKSFQMLFILVILLLSFAVHTLGLQSGESQLHNSLTERANITTAEVLETLATAETCTDCQVCCLSFTTL
jgi:hypothetical protein